MVVIFVTGSFNVAYIVSVFTMPEFIVRHRGKEHDVNRFLHFHPGGSNTLGSFQNCDVTEQLEKTHHAPSAYKLLKDYRIKNDDDKAREFDLEVYFRSVIFWAGNSEATRYNFDFLIAEFGELGETNDLASRFVGVGLQ